ncbi:MAG: amidase [Lactobacillus sp.]|jgi:amidase|nr:amidase [Lactobacillus sp.]
MESALSLAKAIRNQQVSSIELIEQAENRIAQLNPKLNAVVHTRYEAAKQEAAQLKDTGQPFLGVPLLIKGLGQDIAGSPATLGSKLFENTLAQATDNYVQRLQAMGFIIIGQTNVPEFGFKNITDAQIYGPAKNPWNPAFYSGGSSGGAASALASGMVSLATGSDGGGSIRIPASFSGLIGLKPTRGRVPVGPGEYRSWQGAAINFALTTNVADTLAFLKGIQTLQPAAPFQTPLIPSADFQTMTTPPARLKVAFTTESPVGTPVSAAAKAAVLEAITLLEKQGYAVTEVKPDLNGRQLMDSYFVMNDGETAAMVTAFERLTRQAITKDQMEPISWAIYQAGLATTAAEYSLALSSWDQAAATMVNFFNDYDVYLTPTTAKTAPALTHQFQSPLMQAQIAQVENLSPKERQNLVYDFFYDSLTYSPFTQLANLTGQPAISLPTYVDKKSGLPLGIQFMANKGQEGLLLQLASLFENQGCFKLFTQL